MVDGNSCFTKARASGPNLAVNRGATRGLLPGKRPRDAAVTLIVRGACAVSVSGIDHVQLAMPSGGEQLARRFYGEVLGLTEVPKPSSLVARGGCWFQCGALQLHLGVDADFRPAKKAHPALLVTHLAELLEALSAQGFEVRRGSDPVQGRDRAFTADPFGNRIELIATDEKSSPWQGSARRASHLTR